MISQIENYVNSFLTKFPVIKKIIKRSYQLFMYLISKKIKSEGDIQRVTPNDNYEYFFGYYDKSPWNKTERYMICLRAKNTYSNPAPKDPAEIVLIDTLNNNEISIINKSNAWNIQQGCMLQWLGPNFEDEIIFNDFRDGHLCSVIYNIRTKDERIVNMALYDVAQNGEFGISLDFTRLHSLRPGYGYSNLIDKSSNILVPEGPCLWKVNLKTGEREAILTYEQLYKFQTREEMHGAIHGVNHIMINPSGNRFMFLHRWIKNNKKYSRLITVNTDGTDMYNLSDDNMVSHSFWKNDDTIITFARKEEIGNAYFLLHDKSEKYEHILTQLGHDGHPSFSPNKEMIITDSYPNRARLQSLYLVKNNSIDTIARVHSGFRYDNDFRCDLHPRWDRKNKKIAFDSVFEGKRGLYIININGSDTNG